jgi:hypothetical protein
VTGIQVWPSPEEATFPGVTVATLWSFMARGLTQAAVSVPLLDKWYDKSGYQILGAQIPLGTNLGAGCNARVTYSAPLGRTVFAIDGGGANFAYLVARRLEIVTAEGPWRTPARVIPEPMTAVCGYRVGITHNPGVSPLTVGYGFVCKPIALAGGFVWTGGPLPAEGGDMQINATWPYVLLVVPAGSADLMVRVRGNDGVIRMHSLAFVVDPFQPYTADWRVYRATLTRPARYELWINGALAWQQSMDEGPGPGNFSASPTAAGDAVLPLLWTANSGTFGAVWEEITFYSGYAAESTVTRD